MKDSHFSIGMNSQSHLSPAPYKVSNPIGGQRPEPIDKNKLGRESWTLGTYPDTYKTINKFSFESPAQTNDKRTQLEAAKALKARVSASSIKN